MKVVVTGAAGQLGRELTPALEGETVVALSRPELDVCDFGRTRALLETIRPDAVINAAAFTHVDDCEAEPSRAFSTNTYAVRNLAEICADLGCVLVHVSTDYVFDGAKTTPYAEDDLPRPLSVYGVSKLAGEYFVRSVAPKHYVIRTSGIYGPAGATTRRSNFVETMLRLARRGEAIRVVVDQVLTPTSARDAARKIVELLGFGRYGLYHVTNGGECSWFEFAQAVFELSGLDVPLAPTTTAAFGARARRPRYSVLAHTALAELGADDLPDWKDALATYLRGHVADSAGGRA
jgi:dTDP-4-dehydrorhamnose reductase